ncbi:hypothetical protein SUGI_0181230 [Cryptomeria japonica]|nr:hypothetical protein SUGI_0181230 [Cryptomeria japonica]
MASMMRSQFWYHQCNQMIVPTLGDDVCCPRCNGGFVGNLEAPEQRQVEQPQRQSILARAKKMGKRRSRFLGPGEMSFLSSLIKASIAFSTCNFPNNLSLHLVLTTSA